MVVTLYLPAILKIETSYFVDEDDDFSTVRFTWKKKTEKLRSKRFPLNKSVEDYFIRKKKNISSCIVLNSFVLVK